MIIYYLLLGLNIIFAVTRTNIGKKIKSHESIFQTIRFHLMIYCIAFLSLLPLAIINIKNIHEQSFLFAAIYGVLYFAAIFCGLEAIELGSMSLSVLFTQCGFLIPTIFNAIYFNEPINALSVIGIVLIVVALVMTIDKSDKKFSIKWLVFAVLSLICSGSIGIVQKFNNAYYPNANAGLFIDIAFFFALATCLLLLLFFYVKERKAAPASGSAVLKEDKQKQAVSKCAGLVAYGVLTGVMNVFNTFLAGKLPSVVFFPVFNVGVIVLATLSSAIIFKEKLSKRQTASIATGSLAIVLIALGQII